MQLRKIKSYLIRILFFLVFISSLNCDNSGDENSRSNENRTSGNSSNNDYLIVSKVVDGDTFRMSDGTKVRLIGIDTPEKYDSDKLDRNSERSGRDKETVKKLGEAASEYVKALIEGKKVKLESEPGYDDKDKYGRLLRYVYTEDGILLNAKILEDGYATVYNSASITKIKEFKKLEREARENKRGLWGEVDGLN